MELDATNGQPGDENEEHEPPNEELQQERLKVGLKINKDMKIHDTAAFPTNMEIRRGDRSQKPAADCSSGSYPAVLDSLDLNAETGGVQQEQYPDSDDEDHCSDVDASLMVTDTSISECQAEQPTAVIVDPEVGK